ncbi:coiled-coil domain-containing protein 91-like isoform X1 [Stegostoma tigrinum]|uniref:coiled-coil domain-containing protein 91-like isoform X1 n=1 Tax=Stegostoma tigrinum TaxID=3053191 RepID=UPI00202B758E|nr:coiled-coil domain-containing protein 91-like isoform X1 [Stegostoma tigrinum]XP_048404957.1 coiled-coil domain-containing protein 91-like isoform X1 [Stegostoma tigrinum]
MEDDEFGGFEAAESFEDGEMGTQSVSPAIPWAAFSTVGQALELAQNSSDVPEHVTAKSVGSCTVEAVSLPEDESNYTLKAESEENAVLEQGTLMEEGKHVQQRSQPSLNILPALTSLPEKRDPQSGDVLAGHMVAVETNKVETCYKETLENIESQLSTADEKELRIKQEMFEKFSKLEEHLQEGKTEEISYEDSYNQLQDKHKQELEDLRKAGHDALSIIIEEFKALTKSAVQQQQEASRKHLQSAIERQMQKCEELLNTQHERLLDLLEKEKCVLQNKLKETLEEQTKQHKDTLERCIAEERLRSTEAMGEVVKAEKEIITEAVLKAVQEERERMEKIQLEKRELWEIERCKDQEKFEQSIQAAFQEEREKNQEAIREAVNHERRRAEKAITEVIHKAREDTIKYIKEQKRLDQVARQRNLASLELFLSCAQRQLSALLEDTPVATEQDSEQP